MLRISRAFTSRWADEYDNRFQGTRDERVERSLQEWISGLPEPKYLDKEHFVELGRWKTPRQTPAYKANSKNLVIEATRLAYQASDELLKLNILKTLRGVNVAVASTILYFLHPDRFPIFDIRARKSLSKAGKWNINVDDASDGAWHAYVVLMRGLSKSLSVSLRELDKALYAYDKWGR